MLTFSTDVLKVSTFIMCYMIVGQLLYAGLYVGYAPMWACMAFWPIMTLISYWFFVLLAACLWWLFIIVSDWV